MPTQCLPRLGEQDFLETLLPGSRELKRLCGAQREAAALEDSSGRGLGKKRCQIWGLLAPLNSRQKKHRRIRINPNSLARESKRLPRSCSWYSHLPGKRTRRHLHPSSRPPGSSLSFLCASPAAHLGPWSPTLQSQRQASASG